MRNKWACFGLALLVVCGASCDDNENHSCTVSTCLGNIAQICRQGVIESFACPIGCRDGACLTADDVCTENSRRCKNEVPQFCSGQQWRDLAACTAGTICRDGSCVSAVQTECVDGNLQCSNGNDVQKCVSGRWITIQTCQNGYACIFDKCVELGSGPACTKGDKRCSSDGLPQICDADGNWLDQASCPNNTRCQNGACESTLCWKSICKDDETCLNFRCVPNWELTTPAGTECDPESWVDYCSNENEVVSCAKKTGVYRTKCDLGCKVIDLSIAMDGKTWIPAFCDTKWSEKCSGYTNEIPYCSSEVTSNGKLYFQATYQCFPAFGGGYFGIDYGDSGYYEICTNKCDVKNEYCADPKCEVEDSCSGNVLSACSNGVLEDIDCTDYDMSCRQFTHNSNHYADCFDSIDECKSLEETKMKCEYKNSVGVLSLWTCLNPDNESGGSNQKMYWVKTKSINCENGCNADKTGCSD